MKKHLIFHISPKGGSLTPKICQHAGPVGIRTLTKFEADRLRIDNFMAKKRVHVTRTHGTVPPLANCAGTVTRDRWRKREMFVGA